MLRTCSSAHCCIICAQTCACQGCTLFRHNNVADYLQGSRLFRHCNTEVLRLTRGEKKQLLMDKFRSFSVDVTKENTHKYVILIGEGCNMHIVCRNGFCCAYGVSHWYLDDIITRLKAKDVNCLPNMNPAPAIGASKITTDCIHQFAVDYGVDLIPHQIGSMRLPLTEKSMMCSSWMNYYFNLIGDQVPNADHELHLEAIPKKEVYKEYVHDMESRNEECLTVQVFVKLWKDVFPYVKVRKYKSSCGHCNLCTLLGEKRRKYRDKLGRQEVTTLFALHRMSTMGERRKYYERRIEASMNSHLGLSTIADGMQQNHCILPWYGNTKNPGLHIKQHLQGVLMHGHNMTVYRTFSNVGGGANLAIHTWLLSLEAYYKLHSKLPPILYHQIDGGSENTNITLLGICALLVASGLVKKVVLTRLPVGHTHEDIDGLFALIWRQLRDQFVLTPSQFTKLIKIALKKKASVSVVDLLVIPNYTKVMKDCVDQDMARFGKEEWAQLQITFETCEVSALNPRGVKTTYRPYVQDMYVEIVEDAETDTEYKSICGLIPQQCEVRNHPLPGEPHLNCLLEIPIGDFEPDAFIDGSRHAMKACAEKMATTYANDMPPVAKEWDHWIAKVAPQSDDAQEYCRDNNSRDYGGTSRDDDGVYVPFRDKLFGRTGVSDEAVESRAGRPRMSSVGGLNMRVVQSTSCIIHKGNKSAAAKRVPSRNVVLDIDGNIPAQPCGVLNSAYPGRDLKRARSNQKRKELRQKQDAEKQGASNKKKVQNPRKKNKSQKDKTESDEAPSESEEATSDSEATADSEEATSNDRDDEDIIYPEDSEQEIKFHVGDKIVNFHNLAGTVTAVQYVEGKRRYDVMYRNGQTNKAVEVWEKPKRRKRAAKPEASTGWDYEETSENEWVNDCDIAASNVVSGKRRSTTRNTKV